VKVLITDDNPINLKLLRAVLETDGHQVYVAADGLEALDILERDPVDAIISDILMPRMDGYLLCQAVRHDPRFGHLPFIFYTATYTSPSDENLALKLGADDYLRKPAAADDLLATLKAVSSRPRRAPEVPEAESEVVMREYSEALVRKLEHKNTELELAQAEIIKANEVLEERVKERTAQLEAANSELEAFSHSAAHDLRTPLRAISGYCQMLTEDLGERLDPESASYLSRIRDSTRRMNELIEELLKLSHIGRCDLNRAPVDLSELASQIAAGLREANPMLPTQFVAMPGIVVEGDKALLRIALENLLSNAWKFSCKKERPQVEFGRDERGVCYVRDNGAGFDSAYIDKLFGAFQRMHAQTEFPGTGLGLTIVHRIVSRHGGQIWAESAPSKGATFYFKL